jgi:hypothetical protein
MAHTGGKESHHAVPQVKSLHCVGAGRFGPEYPESWNVYHSLGETYMKTGQKGLAVANYEKSHERNPKKQNGADMLKKLEDSK